MWWAAAICAGARSASPRCSSMNEVIWSIKARWARSGSAGLQSSRSVSTVPSRSSTLPASRTPSLVSTSSSRSATWTRNGPISVAGQPGLRQPEHVPGEDEHQHPVRVAERQRVRPVGVVQGEVARGQGGFPAVLDQHRAAAQLQADLVAAGWGRLDQAGRPAGGVRLGGDLDEPQAAEFAAAEQAAEIVLAARGPDLERDECIRQDVLPVFKTLTGRQVERACDIGHDSGPPSLVVLACGRMRGWSRDVPGSARPPPPAGPTMTR